MFGLVFDAKIDLGNLLTVVSLLLGLLGLLYSSRKDRSLRRRTYADKVREQASATLAKLDRGAAVFLYFYDRMAVPMTEADEDFVGGATVVKVRDKFWKAANLARLDVLTRFLDEEIEVAYAPLLPYNSELHKRFGAAIRNLRDLEASGFDAFQARTQDIILQSDADGRPRRNALLGNELRDVCSKSVDQLSTDFDKALSQLRGSLVEMVDQSDGQLLQSGA